VVVFASDLEPARRQRLAESIRLHGGELLGKLSQRVTLLVVGDQALRTNRASARSSQHRRAERWKAEGRNLHIVGESDLAAELMRGRRGG
jgi:BRCT domain type II-containing protein